MLLLLIHSNWSPLSHAVRGGGGRGEGRPVFNLTTIIILLQIQVLNMGGSIPHVAHNLSPLSLLLISLQSLPEREYVVHTRAGGRADRPAGGPQPVLAGECYISHLQAVTEGGNQ